MPQLPARRADVMGFDHLRPKSGGAIYSEKDTSNTRPVNTIGIDLGTCSMRVAYWAGGDVKIIPSDRGNLSIPSCVAFTATGVLVGEDAADQANENAQNTIQAPQRLVGNKFENPWIQWYMKKWPGRVVVGEDEKPLIALRDQLVRPETILSYLLAHAKSMGEKCMGGPVNEVAITVPSRFGAQQKAALAEACRGAGLDVVDFIKSPTAAAIAYFMMNPSTVDRNVLVCDMGGIYLDFALLKIDGNSYFMERAVGTDLIDLDSSIVRFCMADLKDRFGRCIAGNDLALSRIRSACEIAKKKLSMQAQANILVDKLFDGFDYDITVSRGQFEDMWSRDMDSMLDPIDYCLEECGLSRFDVHDVVLVGGCSRIPRIRRAMREFFYGKVPKEVMHPEHAAILGSAVAAAVFSGRRRSRIPYGLPHVRVDQAEIESGPLSACTSRSSQCPNGRSNINLVPPLDLSAAASATSASSSLFQEGGRSSSRPFRGGSVRGVTAPHSGCGAFSAWCSGGVPRCFDHAHAAGSVPLRPADDEPGWHEGESTPRRSEKLKLPAFQDNASESTADRDEAACPSGASAVMSADGPPHATSPVSSERGQQSYSHRSACDLPADLHGDIAIAVSDVSPVTQRWSSLPLSASQDMLVPRSSRDSLNSFCEAEEKLPRGLPERKEPLPHLRTAEPQVSRCREKVIGSGGCTLSSPLTSTKVASSSWDMSDDGKVSTPRPLKSSMPVMSPWRPRWSSQINRRVTPERSRKEVLRKF